MEEFNLEGRDFIALFHLLQLTGAASSGGSAKMLIADGLITVDGKIELRKRCKIRAGQIVDFSDRKIKVI